MVTTDNVEITDLEQYMYLKKNGFKFEGQSYLFWEYVRILTEIRLMNPDVKFLLENVKMAKKWEEVITGALGVEPILINSNLVSAQNRKRLYWTNIEGVTVPEDRGILLKNILEDGVDEKYYLNAAVINKLVQHRERHKELGHGFGAHKILVPEATKKGYAELSPGECFDFENPKSKTRRGRKMIEKSNSLMSQNMSFMNYTSDYRIRRLTPTECSRLQTIPNWYKWECSDTQQYRMLGNGWTVEVIKHILTNLF